MYPYVCIYVVYMCVCVSTSWCFEPDGDWAWQQTTQLGPVHECYSSRSEIGSCSIIHH